MIAIVIVICLAALAVAALVLSALNSGPSKRVRFRLESLKTEPAAKPPREAPPDIRREEHISGIAWLNRFILWLNLAPRIRLILYQAGVSSPPENLLFAAVGGWAALAALIYLRTDAALPAVLLGAISLGVPQAYVLRRRASRFAQFELQLPEALDTLVGALRVGHSLVSGISALGQDGPEPVAAEFRKLFEEQNFGIDLRTSLNNLAVRVPLQDVRMFAAAALIQKESGGNLAEVLEKVASTTRERFRLKKQISVHTAQGRLTGWILSLLPVGLGFGMYLLNPDGMSVLWTRPAGVKMLCTSSVMVVSGILIIRKIVRIRV